MKTSDLIPKMIPLTASSLGAKRVKILRRKLDPKLTQAMSGRRKTDRDIARKTMSNLLTTRMKSTQA